MSKRSFILTTITTAAIVVGGLSAAPPAAAPPTTLPDTARPETNPADTISVADAKPLSVLETDGQETTFTDKLRPPLATRTLYFGEADKFDDPEAADPSSTTPVIGFKDGDDWKAVAVPVTAAANTGWRYVAAGPAAGSIWACLDTVAGDSGPVVVVAHSTDGGATFSFSSFKKPCKMAAFYDFGMTRDGHGKITVALDTDCGKHRAGLYHFESTDAGVNWSANPRFEPDAMIHSETVPEDEQPDSGDDGKKPTRAIWSPAGQGR